MPSNELPYNAGLTFVLDGTISSKDSKLDQIVPMHLKYPLVVSGVTIAPAGTPGSVRIIGARGAQSLDLYGFVDIYFEPLALPDGQRLPLRAPRTRLTIAVTSGHASTVGVEDTIGDAVIPLHSLYHVLRKGRNFELQPGAELRALSQATVTVNAVGGVVIATPHPFAIGVQAPHGSFQAAPMQTPGSYKERLTPPPLEPGLPSPRP